MPGNSSQYALRVGFGLYDPILIQFYNYSTHVIGLFWTWLMFINIGGYTIFGVYKGICLGFEKKRIHITRNSKKMAI